MVAVSQVRPLATPVWQRAAAISTGLAMPFLDGTRHRPLHLHVVSECMEI